MPVLSTLLCLAGVASAGRILARDSTISSNVIDSSAAGSFGAAGQTSTINSGVTYWMNGLGPHAIVGNINNYGNIYASQTAWLKSAPAAGMAVAYTGHTPSIDGGNFTNNVGALVQLNDIGSTSGAAYNWNINTLTNKGTLQLCARGDTGGSTYQLYSDNDSYNTGLISFEQSFGNLGAAFVWRNPTLTTFGTTGKNVYNNGAIRLINTVYHAVQNVYGTGCWQLGAGSVLYMEDGSGYYQNPSYAPTFANQAISFTDPTAVLHLDTQSYSHNSAFGPQLYGFGTGNAIEFIETVVSYSYSSNILTVYMLSGNKISIKLGTGYDASKFSKAFNPSNYNAVGYNAILYNGPAPSSQVAPSTCSITAPVCQNLAIYPPLAASSGSTSTSSSSSASAAGASFAANTSSSTAATSALTPTSISAASSQSTSSSMSQASSTSSSNAISTSTIAQYVTITSGIATVPYTTGSTVFVGSKSYTTVTSGTASIPYTTNNIVVVGSTPAISTPIVTLTSGTLSSPYTIGNTVVVGSTPAISPPTVTLTSGTSSLPYTIGNTVIVGSTPAITTPLVTLTSGTLSAPYTIGNTVVVGSTPAISTPFVTLTSGTLSVPYTIGNTVVVGSSPTVSTPVVTLTSGTLSLPYTMGNTVVAGSIPAVSTPIVTLTSGTLSLPYTIGNTVVIGSIPAGSTPSATITSGTLAPYTTGNIVIIGSTPATSSASSTSSSLPAVTAAYLGCYTEANNTRALNDYPRLVSSSMTLELCQSYCNGLSAPLFGLEYYDECYCGKSLQSGSLPAPETDCSYPCNGNATQTCGGSNRLNIYGTFPPAVTTTSTSSAALPTYTGGCAYQGCFSEAANTRALNDYPRLVNSTNMTLEMCQSYCGQYQSSFFGVEYGSECYCGSKLQYGSVKSPESDCSFACPGSAGEMCGAGNRLNVYACSGAVASSWPTTTSAVSSCAATATTTATTTVYVTVRA